jgi:hypothetical protein
MFKFFMGPIFLLLVSCSSHQGQIARSISSTSTILVLGDSNLVGPFGDELHSAIMNWNEADVFSIAIGGGNPTYYLQPMANRCCGFRVRFSEKGSKIIKIVQKSNVKDGGKILAAEYGSSVFNVIKEKKPSMVVIALGSNSDSQKNYSELVSKIHAINQNTPIYWVGPPDSKEVNAVRADTYAQTALNQFPSSHYIFFSSQKVAKKLHPGPADAKKWVNGFIEELKAVPR